MSLLERFRKSDSPPTPTEVDVTAAHALLQQGAQLVDVREPDEFRAGHASGARNIPLGQLSTRVGEIATDRTVLLICQSGNRSRVAQHLLRRQQITDTRNVQGGTMAWHRAGLPMK